MGVCVYVCMYVRVYVCMCVCVYGCMGCMRVWVYFVVLFCLVYNTLIPAARSLMCMCVWMYRCTGTWLYGCICAWTYGLWMYRCVGVWMYGYSCWSALVSYQGMLHISNGNIQEQQVRHEID